MTGPSLRARLLRGTRITTQPPVTRRAIGQSGDWTRYEQRNGPFVMTWWQHPDGRVAGRQTASGYTP